MVNISDSARLSVAFIGTRLGGQFRPRGTAFFASYLERQHQFDHLVTAEHVVARMRQIGEEMWLRVNLTDGSVGECLLDENGFYSHPDNAHIATDVAVTPIKVELVRETGVPVAMDIRTIPFNGPEAFLPTDEFARESLGPGSRIAIVGLFVNHYGKARNIPIVRMGTIAAKPEEPVRTRYAGEVEAYLVEAMSIGGLSGSPVFAFQEPTLWMAKRMGPDKNGGQSVAFMGLMHGHFDVDIPDDRPDRAGASVHAGIGVVIPARKIVETLEHPKLAAERQAQVQRLLVEYGTAPD